VGDVPVATKRMLGIIDSGIGGLTFLKPLLRHGPCLQIFYCCDSINVPWGEKSQDFMLHQMRKMTQSLMQKSQIDAIFLACNTATAETIDHLRKEFAVPFIGIEPYLNYVSHAGALDSKKIALILTTASFKSERFQKLQKSILNSNLIDIYPLPRLATILEKLKIVPLTELMPEIELELFPLKNKNYTHLILGCTHYPLIQSVIKSYLNVELVDPAPQVLHRIETVLNLPAVIRDIQADIITFEWSENAGEKWGKCTLQHFPFLF
jgi:glutamate racemase